MATEATGAPAEAPAPQEKGKQQAKPAAAKDTPTTGGDAAGEQKLTPAQLKARAKAEKAARRAKAKEVKEAPPAAAAADAKGGKGSKGGKQEGGQSGSQQQGKSVPGRRPSVGGRRPSMAAVIKEDPRSSIPECFSHVPMAKRIQTSQAHKDVHPAVLAVGQQMATFALKDSIARLEATLLAFKKVGNLILRLCGQDTDKTYDRLLSLTKHRRATHFLVTLSPMC